MSKRMLELPDEQANLIFYFYFFNFGFIRILDLQDIDYLSIFIQGTAVPED